MSWGLPTLSLLLGIPTSKDHILCIHLGDVLFKKFFWSVVALQCCISFKCAAKWFSYVCVCVCVCMHICVHVYIVVVVQLLRCVRLFVTPWTAAYQAFWSSTISWSLLKLMSIELVMPSNHLILCLPLPLSSILPQRVGHHWATKLSTQHMYRYIYRYIYIYILSRLFSIACHDEILGIAAGSVQ